jgi:hypothetical protein
MGTTIIDNCKITRVLPSVTAGTTDQNTTGLDMTGYQGVVFVASFGTLTANQVTQIYGQHADAMNATNVLTTPANIAGSLVGPLADNASNKCLVLDINRPQKKCVGLTIDRGTANAVIDGVIAIQYRSDYRPTTQDATTIAASKTVIAAIDGTP